MSTVSLNQSDANLLVYEAFDSGWERYQPRGINFFTRVTPERYDEKFSVHSADLSIQAVADGAAFPSSQVVEQGSVTISQQAYKGEISLNFLMKEFDNYGVVVEEARKQGYRARIIQDEVMADVLLLAESATQTCWDGNCLANATHDIGGTGQTQTNITTGALSESVLNAADVILQTQKDHADQVMPTAGKWLVTPQDLAITAYKLTQSTEGPATANRETGYINTLGIVPLPWPLLGVGTTNQSGNTADSHLIADKMFNRLRYCVKVDPRIYYDRDVNTGNNVYQVEFSCAAGAPDYLGYAFLNAA